MQTEEKIKKDKVALIIDDEKIHRHILSTFLTKADYTVLEAKNGLEGVNIFIENLPDLVFMDVMMPIMDGFDAAMIIKTSNHGKFTPIIFLTALDDPAELQHCIEVGGDDFLTKPININILKTRIFALERTRDLYNQLYKQHNDLLRYLDTEKENQAIANNILKNAILPRNISNQAINTLFKPVATFSGDMFMCGPVADGSFRIMLADFTGHGLAAAMISVPVSETFHTMRMKGISQTDTLKEINNKLCLLLPDDRFMAATIIDYSSTRKELTIWSGGMPNMIIARDDSIIKVTAKGLPLGILDTYDFKNDQIIINCSTEERILLFSDGFLDLQNDKNELFVKSELYDKFLYDWKNDTIQIDELVNLAISLHCHNTPQNDDITLVEVNLNKL